VSGANDETLTVIEERVPPPSKVNDSIVIGFSLFAALCAVVFAVGLVLRAPLGLYGGALAFGLLALAYAVRRFFTDRFPDVEAIEPREAAAEPERVRENTLVAAVAPIARRPLLQRVLLGASAVFGLGLLAPIASLGPSPRRALSDTGWASGVRLVTTDGEALRPEEIAVGGIASIWPSGRVGEERSAALLVRLSTEPEPPTVLDWVVDERIVAYSKVCTHAGCPVALYRERDNALFCPCHQSTFDAARGSVPTFGPAARPLPQLPLGVDEQGFLVALADFQEPVGPPY
jgi:ubiquinol-cytochrome c reductase iron-sulfur subunit